MKILLFGGSGQLGNEIRKKGHDLNFEIISPVLSEVDISNRDQVLFLVDKVAPDITINAAAYTAVDAAEENPDEAFAINRDGAGYVAEGVQACGSRLLHVSTDYVFDGTATEPISEDAPVNPINVYGKSKLEGEDRVFDVCGRKAVIIRTSSLHGSEGENFVHTMLKLFKERERLEVVQDQIMSTTWAGWLAEVLLDLCRIECEGVLHACCAGELSWYDFAQKIYELTSPSIENLATKEIVPVSSADFPRPAKRPKYSVMNCRRLEGLLGRKPLAWEEGLKAHLVELGYQIDT